MTTGRKRLFPCRRKRKFRFHERIVARYLLTWQSSGNTRKPRTTTGNVNYNIELLELEKCTLDLPELVTGNFRSVSMDETGNGPGRKR
jgi:hypothetical protein